MSYLLLFWGAFLAAAISGAAGFGGALLLLPLLSYTVGPTLAVPLLTVAQLLGNLSRVAFGFKQVDWCYVSLFLLGAAPASVVGALGFAALPSGVITRLIGGAILLFTVLKLTKRLRVAPSRSMFVAGGAVVGLLSGLVGSAGPLGAALFLSLNLPPVAYVASEASTAVVMHLIKTVVYQRTLSIAPQAWGLALLMGAAMISGTYVAKRIIERLPTAIFQNIVTALLLLIAMQMLLWG